MELSLDWMKRKGEAELEGRRLERDVRGFLHKVREDWLQEEE
jgi:hypothetical protein